MTFAARIAVQMVNQISGDERICHDIPDSCSRLLVGSTRVQFVLRPAPSRGEPGSAVRSDPRCVLDHRSAPCALGGSRGGTRRRRPVRRRGKRRRKESGSRKDSTTFAPLWAAARAAMQRALPVGAHRPTARVLPRPSHTRRALLLSASSNDRPDSARRVNLESSHTGEPESQQIRTTLRCRS